MDYTNNMPITNICFLIGCLAIAGIPPFAGFFSKDEIISACNALPGVEGQALKVDYDTCSWYDSILYVPSLLRNLLG